MVARVKSYKAGFVVERFQPDAGQTRWPMCWRSRQKNGYSTVAVTDDGTPNGKLLGIVTSRDYRVSPHGRPTQKVSDVHDAAGKARHRACSRRR